MSVRRLTSRNLFDDVFALLPAGVDLDFAPLTVRDELALLRDVNANNYYNNNNNNSSNNNNNNTNSDSNNVIDAPKDNIVSDEQIMEDDILNNDINETSIDTTTNITTTTTNNNNSNNGETWSSLRAPTANNATVSSTTREAPDGTLGVTPHKSHKETNHLSNRLTNTNEEQEEEEEQETNFALPTLTVEMNVEDSAVQEATKYAKVMAEVEANMLEDHITHKKHSHLISHESTFNRDTNMNTLSSELYDPNHVSQVSTKIAQINELGGAQLQYSNHRHGSNRSVRPQLTAEQQLQLMPLDEMHRDVYYGGVCAMYNADKGFGFVAPDLGGPDVYFIKDAVHLVFTRCVLKCYLQLNYMKQTMPQACHSTKDIVLHNTIANTVSNSIDSSNNISNINSSSYQIKQETLTAIANTVMSNAESDLPLHEIYLQSIIQDLYNTHKELPEAELNTMQTNTVAENTSTIEEKEVIDEELKGEVCNDNSVEQACVPCYLQLATRAAMRLSESEALLLLAQLKCVSINIRVRDEVEFNVIRNKTSRQNSRLLRAENIRGKEADKGFALPIEQSIFCSLFTSDDKQVNEVNKSSSVITTTTTTTTTTNTTTTSNIGIVDSTFGYIEEFSSISNSSKTEHEQFIKRYTGTIKYYDNAEDRQRGYIKVDAPLSDQDGLVHHISNNNNNKIHDVAFSSDAFLWAEDDYQNNNNNSSENTLLTSKSSRIQVGMRVNFSVFGREKLHRIGGYRYTAILITGCDDLPLSYSNIVIDESKLRRMVNKTESNINK